MLVTVVEKKRQKYSVIEIIIKSTYMQVRYVRVLIVRLMLCVLWRFKRFEWFPHPLVYCFEAHMHTLVVNIPGKGSAGIRLWWYTDLVICISIRVRAVLISVVWNLCQAYLRWVHFHRKNGFLEVSTRKKYQFVPQESRKTNFLIWVSTLGATVKMKEMQFWTHYHILSVLTSKIQTGEIMSKIYQSGIDLKPVGSLGLFLKKLGPFNFS